MLFLAVATFAPIALFLFLLLVKKWSLSKVSVSTLAAMLLLSVLFWQIQFNYLGNALIKGVFVALDIVVIIIGAIFFLEILRRTKVIDSIGHHLESFSKDYRVQVIMLAWFLENFIEGTAGFGTPAAIVVPLLIALGIQPLKAVVIGLLGNSASVVFGAAGAPIRVGFAGLSVGSVPAIAAAINCVGLLVPAFMLWVLMAGERERWRHFLEGLPFALWSGLVFVAASWATVGLGQEFPSILGSLIGLLIVVVSIRLKIFVPRQVRPFKHPVKQGKEVPLSHIIFPYALLVILLVGGKFLLGSVSLPLLGGATYSLNLFNPGWAFAIAGVIVALFWGKLFTLSLPVLKTAMARSVDSFIVIAAMSATVQLIISSGYNHTNIPSALDFVSKGLANWALPFLAPVLGAFGSFLTGSATVANIMFGGLLNTVSETVGMYPELILALGAVGAAAGNMIALADIMAAEAVVGLKNKEMAVIKAVLPSCLIYVFLVGIVGLIAAYR